MEVALRAHPAFPGRAVDRIGAAIIHVAPAVLRLDYALTGRISGIALPQPMKAARQDGLWRTTCFEAFLRREGEAGYLELNLSPSGEWAAYKFDDYRSGMAEAGLVPPTIETRAGDNRLELSAAIHLPSPGRWRLGLSAVIEETDGGTSYWALAHPPGPPDFHAPACFAAELPPPPGA